MNFFYNVDPEKSRNTEPQSCWIGPDPVLIRIQNTSLNIFDHLNLIYYSHFIVRDIPSWYPNLCTPVYFHKEPNQ